MYGSGKFENDTQFQLTPVDKILEESDRLKLTVVNMPFAEKHLPLLQ